MSRTSFYEVRWLKVLQLLLALLVLAILMGRLAQTYGDQREAALETAMKVMVAQFSAAANVLHGRWMMAGQPADLALGGQHWCFSATGWPRDWVVDSASGACERIWLGVGGKAVLDGERLRLDALPDDRGCEFRLHRWYWHYEWQTGRVSRQ